jgi:HK97 family phage prohead protease
VSVERKSVALELKTGSEGHVSAVFSTFDTIDKDGDVTLPGAFTSGEQVRLLPAHNWAHYAIGKGSITSNGDRAVFDGAFNLKTTAGRDWYESVKDLGDIQEWSYGFNILEAEPGVVNGQNVRVIKRVKVHEVSPVTLGAGVGTGTLDIKSATFAEAIDHADDLVSGLEAFVDRVRGRTDLRAKEGRALSEAHRQRINTYAESLNGIVGDMRELLTVTEKPKQDDLGIALLVLFEQTRDRLRRRGAA